MTDRADMKQRPGQSGTQPLWRVEETKVYNVHADSAAQAREKVVWGYSGIKLEQTTTIVAPEVIG